MCFLTLALILRSTFHTFYSRGKAYELLSHRQYKPLEFITALLRVQRQVCVRDCLYPKFTRHSITGADLGKRAKPMRKRNVCLFTVLIMFSTVHVSLSTYNWGYLGGRNTRKVHLHDY